jgi:glutathione S-transferase
MTADGPPSGGRGFSATDMLTLYHARYTRSTRVRQLLFELGYPHTLERVDFSFGDAGGAAYREVTQLQRLPALKDGDRVLVESVAIMEYLLNVHAPNSSLAVRPDDREHGLYLQWLHFGESGLGCHAVLLAHHTRLLPEDRRIPAIVEVARRDVAKALAFLAQGLDGKEHLLKRGFTAADISVGYALYTLKISRNFADAPDAVRAYADRLFARPSWREASAD